MIHASNDPDYFFTDEMPSGYSSSLKFFYSSEDFLVEERKPDISYYLVNQSRREVEGLAYFYKTDTGWKSPFRSPFGGFDFSTNQDLLIREFMGFVLNELQGTVEIRIFPGAYDLPLHGLMVDSLLGHKFKLILEEPNHHIPVDSTALTEKIHEMERRKLKSSESRNFTFSEEALSGAGRIYDFISHRRSEMNYEISMSREEVLDMVNRTPGHYHLFSVYDGEQLIATTISVVINEDILYNFYPADHPDYRKYSPTVLLNAGLYGFCQDHGYRILDLGTSFLDGKPNQSLIAFKERMGGVPSFRQSFRRD